MLSRWIGVVSTLIVTVAFPVAVRGQTLSRQMRNADERLAKPVSISARHICIGELLERFASQTGVSISANNEDTLSGLPVTAFLSNVPVGDAMNALYSLVSVQNGEWTWTQTGKPGAFHYELAPSVDARNKAAHLRKYFQKAYEEYVAEMIALSAMSPEERRQNKKRFSKAMLQDNDNTAEGLLQNEATWNAVQLFAAAVPSQLQTQVVRGQIQYKISVNQLSSQAQTLFHTLYASYNVRTGTTQEQLKPVPEPDMISFHTSANDAGHPEIMPLTWLDLSDGLSYSVLGGVSMKKAARNAVYKMWLLPDDVAFGAAEQRTIPASKAKRQDTDPALKLLSELHPGVTFQITHTGSVDQEQPIEQIAEKTDISVLAVLPASNGNIGDPAGHSVADHLENQRKSSPYTIHKWRDNILLASYPSWFIEEFNPVPYGLVKRYLRSKDGYINLFGFVQIVSKTDAAQLKDLGKDYLVFREADDLGMMPLFQLYSRYPEIISKNGIRLDPQKIAELRTLRRFANNRWLADGTATALRLVQFDVNENGQKGRVIRAEIQVSDKQWESTGGFIQVAAPPALQKP